MDKLYLLLAFLAIKSVYLPLNRRKSKYYWKLKADDSIPLVPVFIIPYLAYFFLIIYSVSKLWSTELINDFLVSYIVSYVIAGIFWYLVPNGVARPLIKGKSILKDIIRFIYKHDDDTNGFPSAHVFSTLICSYFLSIWNPGAAYIFWIVAALITASTVLVKQHYILDILGGIIVFALSIIIGVNLW